MINTKFKKLSKKNYVDLYRFCKNRREKKDRIEQTSKPIAPFKIRHKNTKQEQRFKNRTETKAN